MIVGVYQPESCPISVANYSEHIMAQLAQFGVTCLPFDSASNLPHHADLLWDPIPTGGWPPTSLLLNQTRPWVATIHGAASFSLSIFENYETLPLAIYGLLLRRRILHAWQAFYNHYAALLTVSRYAKEEIVHYLGLSAEKVTVAYHGADLAIFQRPTPPRSFSNPFTLFHVSSYQPKKNIQRILQAFYAARRQNPNLRLDLVVPNLPNWKVGDGVTVTREKLSSTAVSERMRMASAFIFPSLHESFGMPLVEAMACGLPIITANTTACSEVSGNSAVQVNPRSVAAIRDAIIALSTQQELYDHLQQNGLERAKSFTWQRSTEIHHQLFSQLVKESR